MQCKGIISIFNQIISHPLIRDNKLKALVRFLRCQLIVRFSKEPVAYPYVNNSELIAKCGLSGSTFNCYAGLAEFEEMSFLLHFLREGDFFIDVGAFIGAYTVLASAVTKARTLAIEPIPLLFSILRENIRVNRIQDKVEALNIGLGSGEDILPFTSSFGSKNHVIKDGETHDDQIMVQVKRLEDIVNEDIPILLKIDTEGFETEILKGAEKILNNDNLKAVIIELWKREKLHNKLLSKKFQSCSYNPFLREITECASYKKDNAIYIRGLDFVKKRLIEAPKFKVLDKYI